MPVAYKRFADIAARMGVDTHGMTDVQAAEAALAAAVRLLRDVGIPERFVDVTQDSYSKNRLGMGPTKFYENAKVVKGDADDVDRITTTSSVTLGTPGNAKECTFETVRPVVEHCMNGAMDEPELKAARRPLPPHDDRGQRAQRSGTHAEQCPLTA